MRLLEVLYRRKRIAAASLDGRLLAEVKVVHAATAKRVGMVQTCTLPSKSNIFEVLGKHTRQKYAQQGGPAAVQSL